MAAPAGTRKATAAYIQKVREARGFPARRPTAEEREQQALFWFEAAFVGLINRHGTVVPQQRAAFEKAHSASPRRWDAFAEWLSADAKAEVCAELRLLRQTFVRELEAVGEITVTPQRMAALVHHVRHFVRRAKWRRHPKDYADARRKARDAINKQVEKVQDRLQELAAVLQLLPAPEDDPLSSDVLSGLQWLFDESLLGQALACACDHESGVLGLEWDGDGLLVWHPSERISFALNDLSRRLQTWAPPRAPLWRSLLEPLLRLYEKASGRPATASWGQGKPSGPFSKFLVLIYGALPEDARRFASASPEALVKQAARLIAERNGAAGPRAQNDD